MAKLPISRVVNVTVTREDRFPTRQGFGIPLIVTTESVAEQVDATNRVKVYGSMDEVALDWASSTEAFKSAQAAFSQNPRPLQIKIGHVAPGVLDGEPDPEITDELQAVYDYDSNWYWLTFTKPFRDTGQVEDDIVAWVETRNKQAFLDSNDADMEDKANATNVAARHKNGAFDRTSVFYHTDDDVYFGSAATGYVATRNFDQPNSAYTLKFKRLRTVSAMNKPSAVVQAITGFVPELGLDAEEGHFANAYVNIGGLEMVVEGSTLAGAFIDEIHASDWLIARTQEEVLAVLANNDRVPMTNTGVHQLVAAVEAVMQRAFIAGLIADVEDAETGELLAAYSIEVERVEAIPASQRRQRIAPDIRVVFRYAGAIHYATVRMTMQF